MKPTTENIYNTLTQSTLLGFYLQLKNVNPTYSFQETSLTEAYDEFVSVSELLVSTSNSGLFDKVPFTKRNQIWQIVAAINQSVTHINQFGFNFANGNVVNHSNQVIQQTINLADLIDASKLYAKSIGEEDYKGEIKKLSDLRSKYQKLLSDINSASQLHNSIIDIHKETAQTQETINQIKSEIKESLQTIVDTKNEVEKERSLVLEARENVKSSEQEVETKKLGINTFSENIDEYKERIDKLTVQAKEVLNKETEINRLIQSAELALNLKSAEGISAAFASQYETAKNTGILWKINLWIAGAMLFVCCAIGITIWIALGNLTTDTNGISLIVARVIAVAISITGATFCAKQYIKQRNIAEDYAYKAVLSKSIIAFADEIKKKDEDRVPEYLTKVLDEIHKDPLRGRDNKDEISTGLNPTEIVKELISKIGMK